MKKILIVTAVGTLLAAPAMAVVQCVQKPEYNDHGELDGIGGGAGSADWTFETSNVTFTGVAVCSSSVSIFGTYTALDSISMSETGSSNSYCWCKMTYPLVSRWVSTGGFRSNCFKDCAATCYDMFGRYDTFYNAIFSNLIN